MLHRRKHPSPSHRIWRHQVGAAWTAVVIALCAVVASPGPSLAATPAAGAEGSETGASPAEVAAALDHGLNDSTAAPSIDAALDESASGPAASPPTPSAAASPAAASSPVASPAAASPLAAITPGPIAASPSPSVPTSGSGGSAGGQGGSSHPVPTPSPTPTPMPTITAPPRPATVNAAVPSTLLSTLGAFYEFPAPYYDGCHVASGGTISSKPCLYGNLTSHTTIAIFGDSHALAWFPAVLKTAQDHGWRVLEVTMSACIPADLVQVTASGSVMTACSTFRKAAIAKLTKYHPTVILVTGTRGFRAIDSSGHLLSGAAKTSAWTNGMKRTIAKLIPIAGRVAMIADTPNSSFSDPIGCTRNHPTSILACATSVSRAISYSWLNTEYHVALAKHVAFIDAERWVCRSSPCPLVVGSLITHRNGGHLTVRFARSMYQRMGNALLAIMATPGTVIGP